MYRTKEEILLKFSLNNLSQNESCQNLESLVFLSLAKELMWVVKYFIFCRFRIPMQKSWCYQLVIPIIILKDFSQKLKGYYGGVIINVLSLNIGIYTQLKLTTHFPEKHRMNNCDSPWHLTFSISSVFPTWLNTMMCFDLFKCNYYN